MTKYHNSVVGGHSGFFRTFKRITTLVYWEGMRKDILRFVAACETCQQNKYQALSPAGLLQPLPIPTQGLPRAQGKNEILVVVDRLTKYAHFIPISHPFTTKDIADLFVREVVKLHGFPNTIISDRDKIFPSQFWRELFKSAGTKLKFSSAYHP